MAKPEQFSHTNESVWEWRPRHKTEAANDDLVIPVGPRAQAILRPYLQAANRHEYIFQPRDKGGFARYGKRYNSTAYRRCIQRAIHRVNLYRAMECPEQSQIRLWSPHQLRHTQAQLFRDQFGIEAAQAMLGHESLSATQLYSTRRLDLAKSVALEVG